ncbi:MAG TPA: hypothetical protein VGE06_07635 [Flavisolibacter sp.]
MSKNLLLLCFLILASCRKEPGGGTGTKPGGGSTVTRPVGQPLGDGYTEFIGPEGGTVISPDGQIEVVIPPGALASETEIGIQPITNTATSGIGNGYRLTPHGNIFQKKVTVKFAYGSKTGRISSSKALEVAYQNEKGAWIGIGNAVNDPAQKTIRIQTDHFSDWALIASMELTPVVKTIGLGESTSLTAVHYIHVPEGDDFLVPLTVPEAGTGEPVKLYEKYIVGWHLHGPGRLEHNGAEAVYTAPSATPATKTATITAELNVGGKQVLLISTINIIEDGIMISIDGGPWRTYGGMATKVPELGVFSLGSLRVSEDIPQLVVMWPVVSAKADGLYHWWMQDSEESNVVFEYVTPDLKKIYASVYEDANKDWRDSGGFLSVEETIKDGKKYLTGMFAIDQAGVINAETGEQTGISTIAGTFNVLRSW